MMEVNLPRNTNFDNVLKSSFLVKTCLIGERRIISSSSEITVKLTQTSKGNIVLLINTVQNYC